MTSCINQGKRENHHPLLIFQAYLERTESWRGHSSKSQLLLSFISPPNPICSSTIANWIKIMLRLCNVDSEFTAHSTRSASTSKAEFAGLSEKEILKRASWSGRLTWQNCYRKEIDSDLVSAIETFKIRFIGVNALNRGNDKFVLHYMKPNLKLLELRVLYQLRFL